MHISNVMSSPSSHHIFLEVSYIITPGINIFKAVLNRYPFLTLYFSKSGMIHDYIRNYVIVVVINGCIFCLGVFYFNS